MRTVDIHAHISPEGLLSAMADARNWHGIAAAELLPVHEYTPRTMWTPEQRLGEMDELGVDVQVLSTNSFLYFYERDAIAITALARECNDYVAQLTREYPERFAGFAILPMQDVTASIAELERAVGTLRLKGAMIGDHVNGVTYDDQSFLPFWKAAEALGAVLFIHQSGGHHGQPAQRPVPSAQHHRQPRGSNSDLCVVGLWRGYGRLPGLKVCLAHGGGYACNGAGRMDRGWQVRAEARVNIQQPPSAYLGRFWYDCLTHSEDALRYLNDNRCH